MQVRHAATVCLAAVLLVLPAPAFAHHCFDDVFDVKAPVTVKGKLTGVEWVNPHVMLYVSGADSSGTPRNWVFWSKTPNSLLRTGITRDTLQPGKDITVQGYAAKDKSCSATKDTGLIAACLGDARNAMLGSQVLDLASAGDGAPDNGGPSTCTWKKQP